MIFAASTDSNDAGGRRRVARVALRNELRFSYRLGSSLFRGTGLTMDLSRASVRFEADQELPRNTEIELRMSWPVRLQDVCPLELVVRGRVVRRNQHGFALQVKSCEFRTCGERSFDPKPEPSCSVFG